MLSFESCILLSLSLLLIMSAFADFKFGKIDNHLAFPLVLLSLFYALVTNKNLINIVIIFVSLSILLAIGAIGGGDFKVFLSLAMINYSIALISITISLFIPLLLQKKKVPIAGICVIIYFTLNGTFLLLRY